MSERTWAETSSSFTRSLSEGPLGTAAIAQARIATTGSDAATATQRRAHTRVEGGRRLEVERGIPKRGSQRTVRLERGRAFGALRHVTLHLHGPHHVQLTIDVGLEKQLPLLAAAHGRPPRARSWRDRRSRSLARASRDM